MAKKYSFKKYFNSLKKDKKRLVLIILLVLFFITIPSHLIYSFPNLKKGRPPFREIEIEIPEPDPYPVNITGVDAPYTSAKSAIIVDRQSKAIIFMREPDKRLLPASTTKMVTALVAMENYHMDDIIEIGEVEKIGQVMELYEGEKITVKGLMYGLLVKSGNDAAFALADYFPLGREAFVRRMNQKVTELNLTDTFFTNPAGIDEENHYSTVHDLAVIGAEVISNPTLYEIIATKEIAISNIEGDFVHNLETTNELLGEVRGLRGIKTGWTEDSGECFVSYTERDNRGIIVALLGSYDRFGETRNLVEWVFANHEWQEVRIPEEE